MAEHSGAILAGDPRAVTEVRLDFPHILANLEWAWTHFGSDLLARDLCWRYAVVMDRICGVLSDTPSAPLFSRQRLIQIYEKGIEAAEFLPELEFRMSVQSSLAGRVGQLYLELGNTERAYQFFSFAIGFAERLGDETLYSRLLTGAGEVHLLRGEYQAALFCLKGAVTVARKTGDLLGEAVALFALGNAARLLDQNFEAIRYLRKAGATMRELRRSDLEPAVLQELGALSLIAKDINGAIRCYQDGLTIQETRGSVFAQAQIETALGDAFLQKADPEEAQTRFQEAITHARRAGDRVTEGRAMLGLGAVALAEEQTAVATSLFRRALEIAEECGDAEGVRQAQRQLSALRFSETDIHKSVPGPNRD